MFCMSACFTCMRTLLWKAKSTDTICIIHNRDAELLGVFYCALIMVKLSHIALCRHVSVVWLFMAVTLLKGSTTDVPEWIIYVSIHTVLIGHCSYRETWGTQAVTSPHSVLHSMQAKTLTSTPLNQGYISSYINLHRSLWLTAKKQKYSAYVYCMTF